MILSCKQLYRWKQFKESLVSFEKGANEQDKNIFKIKISNIKSEVFNWAQNLDKVKLTTIANA